MKPIGVDALGMRWWQFGSVVVLVAWCMGSTAEAAAGPEESCAKSAGKARAARMVRHCLLVTSATHPPCNAENPCGMIADHVEQMCRNLTVQKPAFCGEGASVLKLSGAALVGRYADTARADQSQAANALERIQALKAKIEPLVARRKLLAAEWKAGQAEFQKELRAARAAYDKLQKDRKASEAERQAALRAARAQFAAVTTRGVSLGKGAEALDAIDKQLADSMREVAALKNGAPEAARDSKDAKAVSEGLSVELAKASQSRQTELLAREKAAAKEQSDSARRELNLVRARATVAAADATKARGTVTELAQGAKRVDEVVLQIKRESSALETLSGQNAAGAAARAQAAQVARKTAEDQAAALATLGEIEQRLQTAPSPRPAAAAASGCSIESVDFRNFDYGTAKYPQPFKNGKAASKEYAGYEDSAPKVGGVKYFDLDGNGKKEAVVFIEGPPSAHTGCSNELHFFGVDPQCRVQKLHQIYGGVGEGTMKGKSYVYRSDVLESVEGQGGMYVTGAEFIELRYANGKFQELSRKPEQ